jgi:hypothetical protein
MPKIVQPSPLWRRFEECVLDGRAPKSLRTATLMRLLQVSQQTISGLKTGVKHPGSYQKTVPNRIHSQQ